MKLSVYTAIRNGVFLDFPIAEMLQHHLSLADEIVVNEGFSEDDTYERIIAIDPKIRIRRHKWDRANPAAWHRHFKDQARRECTGDWCVLLDADEFIPEWEFARLRRLLEVTTKPILHVKFLHFYANYRVLNAHPERSRWPLFGARIHRNLSNVQTCGDGAQVSLRGTEPPEPSGDDWIECHHFGAVRHPARLREKWRNDSLMKRAKPRFDWIPSAVYDLMPHDWFDEDFLGDLQVYDGPYVRAVQENPERFIRDELRVFEWLSRRLPADSQ